MKKVAFMFLVASFSLLAASASSLASNPALDAKKALIAPLQRLLKLANAAHNHAEAQRLLEIIKQIRASPSA